MRRSLLMVLALILGLAVALAGCGSGSGDKAKSTTTRENPTTTTTLTIELQREAEVLAALDRYWKVTARMYYELDATGAEEVAGEDRLQRLLAEIERRQKEQRPMRYLLEHDYTLLQSGPDLFVVKDRQVNHSLLLDPVTKKPVEGDPNETLTVELTIKRLDGTWKVVDGVKKLEIVQ